MPPTSAERRAATAKGQAMPGGRFPIRNRSELAKAIQAVGRARDKRGQPTDVERRKVRRHIARRARALGASDMIPDSWKQDGAINLAWDESAHPRVGAGQTDGGRFTFKSGGKTYEAGPGGVREIKTKPAKTAPKRRVSKAAPEGTPAKVPDPARRARLHERAAKGLITKVPGDDGTVIAYGDTSEAARKAWSPAYRAFFDRNGGEAGFRRREAQRAKAAKAAAAKAATTRKASTPRPRDSTKRRTTDMAQGVPALHPERRGQLNIQPGVNNVERRGGLPAYVTSVATALMRSGMTREHAIKTARNVMTKTCATGLWGGKPNIPVSAAIRAACCAAVAELKAKNI